MTSWLGRAVPLAALALALAAFEAAAQLPPAAEVVPAGFKVQLEQDYGAAKVIRATKPNENYPKPHMDHGIELGISSTPIPSVDQVLEIMSAQPEDPAGQVPGSATRTEPCGKQRYQGGVLTCRKSITPWIGAGTGPEVMTWDLTWAGKGGDALVGVGVTRYYGPRETAMGWIDAIIPRLKAGK